MCLPGHCSMDCSWLPGRVCVPGLYKRCYGSVILHVCSAAEIHNNYVMHGVSVFKYYVFFSNFFPCYKQNCQVACTASSTCVGYTDATLLHLTQGTVQVAVGVANARCGSPTYPCPPQTLTFEVADVTTSNGQVLTWFHETSLTSMAMLNNTISMTVQIFLFLFTYI